MAKQMKHVGTYGNKPCVVLFREVPGEPDSALIVLTEALPANKHDGLMSVVQSAEGQEAHNISEVLGRRQFSDGSLMFQDLHYNKHITKVDVDMVSLVPLPHQSVPLRDVNNAIRAQEAGTPPPNTDPSHLTADIPVNNASGEVFNSTDGARDPAAQQQSEVVPEHLLIEADAIERDLAKLASEAKAKREQAYQLKPELRPADTETAEADG